MSNKQELNLVLMLREPLALCRPSTSYMDESEAYA